MRLRFTILIGILVTLLFACVYLESSESEATVSIGTAAGVPATIGFGLQDELGQLNAEQSGNTTTYSDGTYEVRITETPEGARSIIRVTIQKVSGEAFRLNHFSVTVPVSRRAIQGIWYPGADPSSTNVMTSDGTQAINDVADANYGIPYIGAASANSRNVFALGLARQDLAVALEGQPADTYYEFRLKVLTARTAAIFDESFYISTDKSMTWAEAARNYADWVDALNDYKPFPVSTRAYEPLYDTWYWSGDRVDDRLYKETAKLASEVGIGLYLADSGWDTDDGEYAKWLGGKTGDYIPPPTKFTSLTDTFNEIRNEHKLGIDLWLQPFAVGRESMRYEPTRDMHIQIPPRRYAAMGWGGVDREPFTLPLETNFESVNLCPRMASTQTYLKELFTEVATNYKPEGYWLDFIDGMATYCSAPHEHTYALFGDGFKRSLQTIKDTILSHDSQAIVHFRARYANLNTKPYANIWQSGDAPADFDRMRLNSIRMRPFSKGVVFAADQMYWPEGTPEEEVSKFVMTSVMVGVPAFGPTLLYSPPETLEMLKAWLSFYRKNQLALATGSFSTFGQLAVPNHKIEYGDRTFAYIRNLGFAELPAEGKTIFLMNATDADRFIGRVRPPQGSGFYLAQVYDRYLVAEPSQMHIATDSKGLLNLNLAVQQGGMVQLIPVEEAQTEKSPAVFIRRRF